MSSLRIGTCSWKYDSWRGIVYPDFGEFNYLEEYCKKYNSVEIDQWFWSLHTNSKVTLPKSDVVADYSNTSHENFSFTIKVPNSITLTHPYKSKERNKYFLSVDLMDKFLHSIDLMKPKVGMLIFQFEYLNKQKMDSQIEFQQNLEEFFSQLDRSYNYAIEIRNPNFLNDNWFSFLNIHEISPVFLQGYFMPHIYDVYGKFDALINRSTVIRLHGIDRKGIERRTNKIWNKIVNPQDEHLMKIVEMIKSIMSRNVDLYLNVNNHYEGSAPLTINKIRELLNK